MRKCRRGQIRRRRKRETCEEEIEQGREDKKRKR